MKNTVVFTLLAKKLRKDGGVRNTQILHTTACHSNSVLVGNSGVWVSRLLSMFISLSLWMALVYFKHSFHRTSHSILSVLSDA